MPYSKKGKMPYKVSKPSAPKKGKSFKSLIKGK